MTRATLFPPKPSRQHMPPKTLQASQAKVKVKGIQTANQHIAPRPQGGARRTRGNPIIAARFQYIARLAWSVKTRCVPSRHWQRCEMLWSQGPHPCHGYIPPPLSPSLFSPCCTTNSSVVPAKDENRRNAIKKGAPRLHTRLPQNLPTYEQNRQMTSLAHTLRTMYTRAALRAAYYYSKSLVRVRGYYCLRSSSPFDTGRGGGDARLLPGTGLCSVKIEIGRAHV